MAPTWFDQLIAHHEDFIPPNLPSMSHYPSSQHDDGTEYMDPQASSIPYDIELQNQENVVEHGPLPPLRIDEALRNHCGITGRQFFIAVMGDDGKPMTFLSPAQRLDDNIIKQFFDVSKFRRVMNRINSGGNAQLDAAMFNFDVDDGDSSRRSRKRQRTYHADEDEDEDDNYEFLSAPRTMIQLQDTPALWNFYEQRFKNCQQMACKLIAKAWVKAVEPKKQSNHPYTGSDERAPDWWPKPWGTTKDDKVRHKEPDHLYKRERVHLLVHILSMVMEPPARQHRDVRRMNLNVTKLEETTFEALSSFFMESLVNSRKKPFLHELFSVAKHEERYRMGGADGLTEVYVMTAGRLRFDVAFVKDETEEPSPETPDEDDKPPRESVTLQPSAVSTSPTEPSSFSVPSPNGKTGSSTFKSEFPAAAGPPSSTKVSPAPTELPAPTRLFDNARAVATELPIRSGPFPNAEASSAEQLESKKSFHSAIRPSGMQGQSRAFSAGSSYTVADQSPVAGSSSNLSLDMVDAQHASRRPSAYSEFARTGDENVLAPHWSSLPVGSVPSTMFTFTQPHSMSSQNAFLGQSAPVHMNQSFGGEPHEDPERPDYHGDGAVIFHPSDLSTTPAHQQHGFYMPGNAGMSMGRLTNAVNTVPDHQM